jgi:hypothetical protein
VLAFRSSNVITNSTPVFMRLKREGDRWRQSHSHDGINWIESFEQTHELSVTAMGLFVGNTGGHAPQHRAVLDYFYNTAALIPDKIPPLLGNILVTASDTTATIHWTTDEPATSHLVYGRSRDLERGVVFDSTLMTEHSLLLSGLMPATFYHFKIISGDSSGNEAEVRDLAFHTTAGIVSAVEADGTTPTNFELAQNHPNPFNPSTTIRFSLPISGLVTLKIFSMNGEEIATLLEQELPAGTHQQVWKAEGLASGMYICQLSLHSPYFKTALLATKKLVLMK